MKINAAVLVGLMAAFSIVLGVIENFIPSPFPAIRLGISNIPILVMIYLSSPIYALEVALLKAVLVPVFSGNFLVRLSLSLPATLCALLAMYIVYKFLRKWVSPLSVSVIGAVTHMIVQLSIMSLFYIKGLIYTQLTGILLFASVITGVLMGIISYKIITSKEVMRRFQETTV